MRKNYDSLMEPEVKSKPFDGEYDHDGPDTPLGSLFSAFRKSDLHYDNLDLDANLTRLEKIKK